MSEVVDLNSDLGEGGEHDEEILEVVTSANIACGFHAGDPASVFQSIRSAKEVVAGRNYLPDGSLVPRSRPDALLHDPIEAAERVVRMLREGVVRAVDGTDLPIEVETICVHSDTPEAVGFVRELRRRLELENVAIAAPAWRR